jgi:hypothetical protein
MSKKHIIGVLLAGMLLVGVASTYALTWYRLRTLNNRYVTYRNWVCYNMPTYYSPLRHRFRLFPVNADVDLRLYGYRNGTWYVIGNSSLGGLYREQITITRATRNVYSTLSACAFGWGGSSYFHLRYDGGY